MLGFLRKVQTSLCLYDDLWNKSTNEITPLIDGTIRIATVEPFSNADFFHYALMYLCSAIYDAFYHKTFLDRSELTVRKSGSIKNISLSKDLF